MNSDTVFSHIADFIVVKNPFSTVLDPEHFSEQSKWLTLEKERGHEASSKSLKNNIEKIEGDSG